MNDLSSFDLIPTCTVPPLRVNLLYTYAYVSQFILFAQQLNRPTRILFECMLTKRIVTRLMVSMNPAATAQWATFTPRAPVYAERE